MSLLPSLPITRLSSQKGSRHVTLCECLIRLIQLKTFSANEMALATANKKSKRAGGGKGCSSISVARCFFHNERGSKQYEGPTKPQLITSISPTFSSLLRLSTQGHRRKSHASRALPKLHRAQHKRGGCVAIGRPQIVLFFT